MHLSSSSLYALRALAYLSKKKGPLLSREIANSLSIPPPYMTKVLQTLRLAGIVRAFRGPTGGFSLKGDPSTIKLKPVIQLFEDLSQWDLCPFNQTVCGGTPKNPCSVHPKWKRVSQSFSDFINHTTVADITLLKK